jgi:uncharacterized protein YjiS (DUF1127 family)
MKPALRYAVPATLVLALASAAFLAVSGEPLRQSDDGVPAMPAMPAAPRSPCPESPTHQEIPAMPAAFLCAMFRIQRRVAELRSYRRAARSLRELDARTLHDIGVDPSDLASIEAEHEGLAALTRRRVLAASPAVQA